MARDPILANAIAQPGQSQDYRLASALDPASIPIDERTPEDRIAEARRLAKNLQYYDLDPVNPAGSWESFFPPGSEALLSRDDGSVPPHLALFGAFLRQLEPARQAINRLTGHHLDFQYRRVLGFEKLPAKPEHAHLVLELKKKGAPIAVTPLARFSGGKDAEGSERFYRPLTETVIGQGRITALHSVFHDGSVLRFAPLADSGDGLGSPLDPARPQWSALGHPGLPLAPVGLGLAGDVLQMAEGTRQVTIRLVLTQPPADLNGQGLADCLQAYLSGAKGWIGPCTLQGQLSGTTLQLTFSISAGEPAVVGYSTDLHGGAFATAAPVLQLMLKPARAEQYRELAALGIRTAQLQVQVAGLRQLTLENDFGSLNPKKAFQPFGPQPVKGGRFMIGCSEALSKQLTDLQVALRWQGAPDSFSSWYAGYPSVSAIGNGVSAQLAYSDLSGQTTRHSLDLMARDNGETTLSPSAPPPGSTFQLSPSGYLYALMSGGSLVGRRQGERFRRMQPVALQPDAPPHLRSGYVTVTLQEDFLHAEYRSTTMQLAKTPDDTTVLNEPYTPVVQEIRLGYTAVSPTVDLTLQNEASFGASLALQCFHIGPFGQRREHGFLRKSLDWVSDRTIRLLPDFQDEGEFIIGVSGVAAGDSINLLLQVAEGSADPELTAQPVQWSILCDNHWRQLLPEELTLDTTRGLRASGVVGIVLSRYTTTENSWLPSGQVWLQAAITRDSAAACRLLGVWPNALETVRVWPDDSGSPSIESLPAGTITKMLTPPAALKKVSQPYATFGGRAAETDQLRNRRAAERLRHRQRCITPWDFERLLLEAFPTVDHLKCIPHASDLSWMAPGNVLLIAIPDLRNQNAIDPLQPRVDLDTLTRMQELARQHAGSHVTIRVRNAHFVPIRLDFKVRFKPGYPFAHTRQRLHLELVQALSPWAFAGKPQLQFGGRIYRSVLLNFVEERDYVDFVTDFRCGHAGPGETLSDDAAEIGADRPDAILVSAARHVISEAE